ncbi:MAG: hypothetical protein K9W43_13000 [Candidatus Thorarchaeota archaeon]|nr:hypothetical protein [Candidatus Thorarchaeota archaeon]
MALNAYFTIVLLAIALFFIVWGLGWLLENLSHRALQTTRDIGSRAWRLLVGPGVALHESSHALGCVFTGTEIVEFKPINIEVTDDGVILGYVRHRVPSSPIKGAIIGLAPVAVSLILLVFFALGATYLVPGTPGIGGEALQLLQNLISLKANPTLLNDPVYPLVAIFGFVYEFIYTFAGLTVVNPLFWIVAFLAMTIMFSNAPSDVDIKNSATGLKIILIFDLVWLIIAFLFPVAGWALYGIFELIAVMWALSLGFAIVGFGLFLLIAGMSRIQYPYNILPFIVCLLTGVLLLFGGIGTPAFQTVVSIGAFAAMIVLLMLVKGSRQRTI